MLPGASGSRHIKNAWLVLVHGQHVTCDFLDSCGCAPADRYIGNVLDDLEVLWQLLSLNWREVEPEDTGMEKGSGTLSIHPICWLLLSNCVCMCVCVHTGGFPG